MMKTTDEQLTHVIGLRLKQKRIQANKTILEVAEESGIARSTLQNYESGIRRPSLGKIGKLAMVLHTSVSYLAGIADTESEPDSLVGDDVLFKPSSLIINGLSPNNILTIKSNDNLMEPDIHLNDQLLIDTSIKTVNKADMYAVKDQSGNIMFRWGRKEIGRDGFIIYATKNVHFPDLHVTDGDPSLTIIGRVACVIHWR